MEHHAQSLSVNTEVREHPTAHVPQSRSVGIQRSIRWTFDVEGFRTPLKRIVYETGGWGSSLWVRPFAEKCGLFRGLGYKAPLLVVRVCPVSTVVQRSDRFNQRRMNLHLSPRNIARRAQNALMVEFLSRAAVVCSAEGAPERAAGNHGHRLPQNAGSVAFALPSK